MRFLFFIFLSTYALASSHPGLLDPNYKPEKSPKQTICDKLLSNYIGLMQSQGILQISLKSKTSCCINPKPLSEEDLITIKKELQKIDQDLKKLEKALYKNKCEKALEKIKISAQ